MRLQGTKKRQQAAVSGLPEKQDGSQRAHRDSVAAILSTAHQLAPLVSPSNGSSSAQNLPAAEQEQSTPPWPFGNGMPAAQNLQTAVMAAAAEEHGTGRAACNNTSGRLASSLADGNAAEPLSSKDIDPGVFHAVCSSAAVSMGGALLSDGSAEASKPTRLHNREPQSMSSSACSAALLLEAGSAPCAEKHSISADEDGQIGSRLQLQGVPAAIGSHTRFDSDDGLPLTAPVLEDSEVIAQLDFEADAHGHLVISFSGRSMAPELADSSWGNRAPSAADGREDGAGSRRQAGPRQQEYLPKIPKHWCAPELCRYTKPAVFSPVQCLASGVGCRVYNVCFPYARLQALKLVLPDLCCCVCMNRWKTQCKAMLKDQV